MSVGEGLSDVDWRDVMGHIERGERGWPRVPRAGRPARDRPPHGPDGIPLTVHSRSGAFARWRGSLSRRSGGLCRTRRYAAGSSPSRSIRSSNDFSSSWTVGDGSGSWVRSPTTSPGRKRASLHGRRGRERTPRPSCTTGCWPMRAGRSSTPHVRTTTTANFDVCRDQILHEDTVIGLGDGGAHVGIICDASFPTTLLTHWGRDRERGRGNRSRDADPVPDARHGPSPSASPTVGSWPKA